MWISIFVPFKIYSSSSVYVVKVPVAYSLFCMDRGVPPIDIRVILSARSQRINGWWAKLSTTESPWLDTREKT